MPRTDGDSDCEVQCGPSSTTSGPGTGTEKKVPLGGQTLHERMAAIDTVEDFDEHIVQSYRGLSHPALCAQAFWLQAADWYVSIMMDCHFPVVSNSRSYVLHNKSYVIHKSGLDNVMHEWLMYYIGSYVIHKNADFFT